MLKLGFLLLRNEEEQLDSIDQTLARLNLEQFKTNRYWFLKSLRKDLFCWKDNLNILIRELIFYWNIASLRLDFIYCRLRDRKKERISNTGYHFLANSDGILAEDIDEKRKESFQWMTRADTIAASLWCGDSDPFSNLRYCYCFKDLNLEEKRVSLEEITLALESI